MRNSIHQPELDYAALVTERERESESECACVLATCTCTRAHTHTRIWLRDGARTRARGPDRGREKLALEYLKARRSGGNEMGANTAEEQRERERDTKREWEKGREEKRSRDSGVDDQTPPAPAREAATKKAAGATRRAGGG